MKCADPHCTRKGKWFMLKPERGFYCDKCEEKLGDENERKYASPPESVWLEIGKAFGRALGG